MPLMTSISLTNEQHHLPVTFSYSPGEDKESYSRFLDVIAPQWCKQLIGVGSDGANIMTGHLQGVVTQMVRETNHKVY